MREKPLREKLLLVAVALIAFGGGLWAPFVFDDFALLNDPAIASPDGWVDCWRLTQTRPLTWFTFWLNWMVAGENPWSWHAVNLALHVAVVLLAYSVLRKLLPDRTALFAAAIFAVHPMLTEPVVYVFSRAILLAALFSLLAMRDWISGREWRAVLWFLVAMLAKEEVAALPIALLVLRWKDWRVVWRPVAAMLGIALVLGARTIWATTVVPSGGGMQAGISPLDYFATQGVVILRYVGMVILPFGFAIDVEIARPVWWLAIGAWAVVGFLACKFRWFLIALILLLPSSSIFPASDVAADRRVYLPMVAFAACVALLAERVDRRVVVAIVIALAGISIYYTGLWRSPESLWRAAAERSPGKTRPKIQWSRALPPENALEVLARAPQDDPQVASEMGRRLYEAGRVDESLAAFGRALAMNPNDARAINNRGVALAALGQSEAARADFESALKRDPCLFDTRLNLRRMGVPTPDAPGCRYTQSQKKALSGL
ncbi:MAG TPA: tetratricopeptide repeat protein [Bryobacteraceae bacterium]|nr:tetratricopeptide repeat protein [Bryobacteraceae bacterium]